MNAPAPATTTAAKIVVLGASAASRDLGQAVRRAGHHVEYADPQHLNGEVLGADLVLLDVGMEGAGSAALGELGRRAGGGSVPPFVVIAPEITTHLALLALRGGAVNVFRHPAPLSGVLEALASARERGSAARLVPLDVVEREHILAVLEALDGNKQKAAQLLGIDRKTLYRKLKRYDAEERGSGPDRARAAQHAVAAPGH